MFLSSHLLAEIDQLASHVGVIDRGRLLFQGSIESLRERTARKLLIQVAAPEAAERVLRAAGWPVARQGNALELPAQAAGEAGRQLASAGIAVLRTCHGGSSLEDAFLSLVENGGSL